MKKNYTYDLSVIIVNYNVEFFLEQCLNSVGKASEHLKVQVFVVDNNSIDGSVDMVRKKFPDVNLIANKDNKGFSKANNQAIVLSNARYVLLLNPDTVVEEDTFDKIVAFMDQREDVGGLGVRMIDGKGKFLPESKRGLPTPAVAFYKIFGISKLFSKSKRFGRYHLGYLSEFENNEIEILSGAFMFMRSEALEKVGLLDETFFMYGEDIDLSYRILKGGYKNYYFADTRIIHYKGESTKKSSINYVFVFYRAMIIFAEKHFSQKNARLFSFLINLAIYFRAFLALAARFIKRSALPLSDFALILTGLYALTHHWSVENIHFPSLVINFALPAYSIIWMLAVLFTNGYDRKIKFGNILKGVFLGTIFILVIYALLPKNLQFSRLFILTGALWTFFFYVISRIFLHFTIGKRFNLSAAKKKKFGIVGSKEEFDRVSDLLKQTNDNIETIEQISVAEEKDEGAVGTLQQLDQIIHMHGLSEVIFCARDTAAHEIIKWMSSIDSSKIDFKIAQPDSISLIGSNSIDTAGDLYVMNINAINRSENIRNKRMLDLLVSTVFILLSPLSIFLYENKKKFISNLFRIWIGKSSFVGYNLNAYSENENLPRIKNGVLNPTDPHNLQDPQLIDKMNLIYARDYTISKDISILMNAWKLLDR